MISVKELKESFFHLLFPHVCAGCGIDVLSSENTLCLRCIEALPETNFELYQHNPVEKKFWGRLSLHSAAAHYYFSRESLMQQLIHLFKYKGNKEVGLQLGRMMGTSLKQSGRFSADALIPLPLFASREKRRGYNQAMVLCEGIAEQLQIPILNDAIMRPLHTETQTHMGRIDRWKNIDGKFILTDPASIAGKHLLLIDDVITTGATLESCGAELLKAEAVQLSIACLCYASR
ncbi:MAG: phosphoribosyltransferase family protein [Chitinophagaceae bacterium]